jgi:hypothetical protein
MVVTYLQPVYKSRTEAFYNYIRFLGQLVANLPALRRAQINRNTFLVPVKGFKHKGKSSNWVAGPRPFHYYYLGSHIG